RYGFRFVSSVAYFFRVLAAFFAEREREAADLFFATARACRESDSFEAALRPSRLSAFSVARERLFDGFLPALRVSLLACSCVSSEAFSGGGKSTPARRAFERPIAIACFAERAPCFPSRMCSISSRTNSPACVLADFPARLALRARSTVFFSGMADSFEKHDPCELESHTGRWAFVPTGPTTPASG